VLMLVLGSVLATYGGMAMRRWQGARLPAAS